MKERSGIRIIAILLTIITFWGCKEHDDVSENKTYTLPRQPNYISEVWQADQEDGTYKNPILYADYSDPDVIRVGNDFFMTVSSFNCTPGLPILHSKDLVNWSIINYAVNKQIPEEVFNIPQHSKGVWAPSMRHHNGEFYIYWGDPDYGVFMVKAKDPSGEWSEPIHILKGKGIIDPCPIWDGENTYLVHAWAGSRAGVNSLLTVRRMNAEGTKVLDEGKHIFDGHDNHHTVEGPKLYKKDGFYYIFAPAGGVEEGWQLVLRSKNIYGPYEGKVVLEQGSTSINGPHQGAWVTTQSDESWFVHFQDQGVYGRVLHLNPVKWIDGWPIMGKDLDGNGVGEPVRTHRKPDVGKEFPVNMPRESDEFNNGEPGLQWQWYANPSVKWSAQIPGTDYLRLFAMSKKELPNLWDMPNLLLQKLPAPDFTVTTKVKLNIEWDTSGKTAGLLMMGQSYAYIGIAYEDGQYWVKQVNCIDAINGTPEKVIQQFPLQNNEVVLRMEVQAPDATCHFSFSEDGEEFIEIGETFKAQKDLWISAKIGIFSVSEDNVRMGGYADFDWFRVGK
ncbi:glycoside hydrolase 43 family protein [Galbibacter sp. EGI 63066]|uniref:glycoside hydrolase family 43 protein n=1 Tax=Galbibacter sp. EGI 63066 TaxID=2993559 RepID=UPI00224971DE|nr:glycoside hydrolase 43 family protein [Galbibacter sp. EGI 63066]MCX2678674.1 glycoside hydrolase 43 family protein [Galbibacter sp. EGI 63066]